MLLKKRKELLLSGFSILFTLLFAELFISEFFPQIMEHDQLFEYDSQVGWKFTHDKEAHIKYGNEVNNVVKINSWGFRDHPPSSEKAGAKKILLLGDSFVSNIAVDDDEVFTEIMEKELPNTEVLNFGVNGYGQVQEYLLLKKWFDEVQPDLIILVIYIRNDFTDNLGGHWLYKRPYASFDKNDSSIIFHLSQNQDRRDTIPDASWKFYQKMQLYALAKRVGKKLKHYKTKEPVPNEFTPPELYLCRSPINENTEMMYRIMEELLLKFHRFAREKNVPLVFALAPSTVQVNDELWEAVVAQKENEPAKFIRSLPNDRLTQFAYRNGLHVIDLLPILKLKNQHVQLYNEEEQHWNKTGNEAVAETLLHYLYVHDLIK